MGLAGARKRQKISHDPNNTTWARDTTGFGHKILAQQGWTPGSFLGARDAAQTSHFSAASASHIRVALKDDNLGIGAKRVGETAENFGLGALVDIFGRLNGKDEHKMRKEQQARADIGARLYAEQRYGAARFVRGGFLVGDKIEKDLAGQDVPVSKLQQPEEVKGNDKQGSRLPLSGKESSGKLDESIEESNGDSDEETGKPSSKKRKKESSDKKDKESKRIEKKKRKSRTLDDEADVARKSRSKSKDKIRMDEAEKTSKKDKADRKESKEERRKRRQDKKMAKLQKQEQQDSDTTSETVSAAEEPVPAPVTTFGGSRQAVRRRYIQAKKMAGMDPQALRESTG